MYLHKLDRALIEAPGEEYTTIGRTRATRAVGVSELEAAFTVGKLFAILPTEIALHLRSHSVKRQAGSKKMTLGISGRVLLQACDFSAAHLSRHSLTLTKYY